jgi:hypothetical protein
VNNPTLQEYGGQLERWTESFATGRYQDFEGELENSTPDDVKRFLINSFGNRYTWLVREVASVAGAFEDFPALIDAYMRAVPYSRFDVTGPGDEERFLIWLTETQPLTPVQRDYVTFQRGEYAVAREGRRNRPAHLAFQALRNCAGGMGAGKSVRIHLNPIRFAAELLTPTFAPGVETLPVRVLFYADGTNAGAILLDAESSSALDKLALRGPCTLEELAAGSTTAQRQQMTRLLSDLAAQGVVVFETDGVSL